MPSRLRPLVVRSYLASSLAAAAALVFSASGAAADCSGGKPCVTKLVPVPKTPTFGGQFMLRVHWSSACKYDKFHFQMGQEHSPTEVGGNRNQLCNRRSHTFLLTRAQRGSRITVRVQGCEGRIIGKDACTPFSAPVSVVLISPQHAAGCRNYANRAVGAAKLARDTYKCDPQVISGGRWSPNFDHHFNWCETAEPKTANFEDRERIRIMHECRVKAAGPKGGKAAISVRSQGGDTFFITGSGFAPNAPVIIRLSGPGASIATVTVANNQRITADAKGNVSIRLFGAQICKRGGGTVTFTAEDQDNPKSPPASAKCAP